LEVWAIWKSLPIGSASDLYAKLIRSSLHSVCDLVIFGPRPNDPTANIGPKVNSVAVEVAAIHGGGGTCAH
tara:strand:- start:733 stop:945 length:213 start_codon:yes stop_codon:yes gene_type:complete